MHDFIDESKLRLHRLCGMKSLGYTGRMHEGHRSSDEFFLHPQVVLIEAVEQYKKRQEQRLR